MATVAEAAQNCDPSLSLAQSGSGQGGNRPVPKEEREIYGVDIRVVNCLLKSVDFGNIPVILRR